MFKLTCKRVRTVLHVTEHFSVGYLQALSLSLSLSLSLTESTKRTHYGKTWRPSCCSTRRQRHLDTARTPSHTPDTSSLGLGTGTDNRTVIFTGISSQNRYFAPVYRSTQCCSDLLSLSLSSNINGHSQDFDFYARFKGFLVALPKSYWQER